MGDIGESGNAVLQTIQASEGGRALRLLRQRQRMRQRVEEEKQKIESKGLKKRNLTFGGSSADRLEDEFKKETIGLLTAEAFKEKRARLEEQIRVEQRSLFPQKLQEKRRMELCLSTKKLSFGDSEEADEVLVQVVDKALRESAAEAALAAAAATPAPAPVSAASHHAFLARQQQQQQQKQQQETQQKEEQEQLHGREKRKDEGRGRMMTTTTMLHFRDKFDKGGVMTLQKNQLKSLEEKEEEREPPATTSCSVSVKQEKTNVMNDGGGGGHVSRKISSSVLTSSYGGEDVKMQKKETFVRMKTHASDSNNNQDISAKAMMTTSTSTSTTTTTTTTNTTTSSTTTTTAAMTTATTATKGPAAVTASQQEEELEQHQRSNSTRTTSSSNNSNNIESPYISNRSEEEEEEQEEEDKEEIRTERTHDNISNKENANGANKEMAETLSVVWRRRRRIGKDPTVDTNFLPDEDRDAQVLSERQRLIEEYRQIEAEARKEPLWVTYSFWDGTGHRRRTCVRKGSTVLQFLDQARSELEKEFVELRGLSAQDLLYVKEDLILPHNTTFYELIKTKARGKSGPLFTFNVHEDVRMVNDSRLEKADSHAGKVVERKWFERNKHIFPASRWEVYSPQKAYDTYTIHGGVHKWKGMSNSEIREAIV